MKSEVLKHIAQRAKRRLIGRENYVPAKIKIISNDDADLKGKVEFLLAQNEVVSNPVHYLIDDKVLNNMGDVQKEKYLFDMLDKYSKLKAQMENMQEQKCL